MSEVARIIDSRIAIDTTEDMQLFVRIDARPWTQSEVLYFLVTQTSYEGTAKCESVPLVFRFRSMLNPIGWISRPKSAGFIIASNMKLHWGGDAV